MFRWVPYPFLRFTPALVVGILLGTYAPINVSLIEATFLFLVYATAVISIPAKYQWQCSSVLGVVGLVVFLTLGAYRTYQYDITQQPNHLLHYLSPYSHYVATVVSAPERRTNSWRVTAQLERVITQDSSSRLHSSPPLQATLLLYQPLADSLHLLQYGDQILAKGVPDTIQSPTNPHAFDLRHYWAQQQIFHQHYLRSSQWRMVSYDPPNPFYKWVLNLRRHSQKLLAEAVDDPEARGIALALVLGVKDQLGDEVRAAYGRAGAMHVLAVSGLHMGIVYGVVAFLLRPLRRIRRGRGWHALLCIATLWLFALVSGGSVSVMRAATMFTCIIVADATQRQANIFNTLALSAFLLLLVNPSYLFSVGFQLSYLAVLGIVYLQPRIYRSITCSHPWLDYAWALTSVSIAAQIATLPISLYYFHQFPTYFWLANIFVIPTASMILSLGLLIVGTGSVLPSLANGLGILLENVTLGVNTLIFSLERLPMNQFSRIHIDALQVAILYAAIIAWIMLFHYRKFRYWVYGCCLTVLMAAVGAHRHWSQGQQQGITFYHTKGQSNVDFTDGRVNYHWGDWNEQAAYQVDPHHLQAGLTTTRLDTASAQHPIPFKQLDGIAVAVWKGKRLAVVQRPLASLPTSLATLSFDYLVISNNAVRELYQLKELSYDLLIIDSSNGIRQARKLAKEAEEYGIAYHSVPAHGALSIAL